MTIKERIYNALSSIGILVEQRYLEDEESYPYLVVAINNKIENSLDGSVYNDVEAKVIICSDDNDDLLELEEDVIAAMESIEYLHISTNDVVDREINCYQTELNFKYFI